METISLEKKLVELKIKIELLEQDNSNLRRDLLDRLQFNKMMVEDKLRLLYKLDELENRVKILEEKPVLREPAKLSFLEHCERKLRGVS